MAFCRNCGTQLHENVRFCGSCGVPAGEVPSAAVPGGTPGSGTGSAQAGAGPTVKTLLAVIIVLLVVILGGVASALYFMHRAHQQVQQLTQTAPDAAALLNEIQKSSPNSAAGAGANRQSTGALLDTLQKSLQQATANSSAPRPLPALEKRHVSESDGQCSLFTKEELTKVLGDEFTHADADATSCTYKGDAPRLWLKTEILWTGGHKLLKEKADSVEFMRQSMRNQHYSKEQIATQEFPQGKPYPGVGEEGWINMWNVVIVRKGDRAVTLELQMYHDSDDTNRLLANTAISRVAGDISDSAAIGNHPVQ
jgi:hypothetical protein